MSDPNQEFQPPPPPVVDAPVERRRPANLMWLGLGIVVLGIIIIVGGILNFIVGGGWTGAAVAILGIVFFAFSFMRLPNVPGAPPALSTVPTLTGIFFEPTTVIKSFLGHPKWAVALLIAGIITGAYGTAFMHRLTPERVIGFTTDKLADSPFKPPPEVLDKMRTEGVEQAKSPTFQAGEVLKKIVGIYIGVAIIAGLCLLGVLAFGGRMHYWQTLAAVAYVTFPATLIQKVVSFIILMIKSPEDVHPILGQETLVYNNLGLLVSSKDHPVL